MSKKGKAGIKIHKFIAGAGVCSRRNAEELIERGKVTVNDKTAHIGQRISPERDEVKVEGKVIEPQREKIYIILNKPKNVITTCSDKYNRKTVLDLVKKHIDLNKYRLFPVGRLDKDSTGLVLLTNDGELMNKILHPAKKIPKVYVVEVTGHPPKSTLKSLESGVKIEGKKTLPCKINILSRNKRTTLLKITLYQGRKRQIKKMMKKVNHPVVNLEREKIGPLSLGDLNRGNFRILSNNEQEELHAFVESRQKGD